MGSLPGRGTVDGNGNGLLSREELDEYIGKSTGHAREAHEPAVPV